jgi:translation initiation factor IF-1
MPTSDSLKHQALVVERLSMARFRVELAGGRRMLATVSGRLRLKFTRISVGHQVVISVSPYDLNQGTIIQRLQQSSPSQ